MTVLDWLLDSDPSIRCHAMRDLTDASPDDIRAERSRIATEGWGARLLSLQGDEGQWDGGTFFPADYDPSAEDGQPWSTTAHTLALLREFGLDPASEQARRAVALVDENSRWEHAGQRFFDGEVEPCINGMAVAIGSYFGKDVDGIVARLLGETLNDGGWNCWAEEGSVRSSFHSTIRVLEGLLEFERATGGSPDSVAARRRAEEYLLERRLFRRKSTGEVISSEWLMFAFPTRWHYDLLRGLDYFRSVGGVPDKRLADAIDVVRAKRRLDGTWLLENTYPGRIQFEMEDGDGLPSRWNTLRAMRVLDWWDSAD